MDVDVRQRVTVKLIPRIDLQALANKLLLVVLVVDEGISLTTRVRVGSFKGCIGIIKEVKGQTVLVELEAQIKIVTVNVDAIVELDTVTSSTPSREKPHYCAGSDTPASLTDTNESGGS
ncbi:hypothetical protein POM88_037711 [Heracleum sosnowskyi]|uniref:KOW domain-containing protein n=1 Tax=Heracleum sosnowskyi TaxID=360622 RepID=A0AAD8HQM1_9APIA|nr:hypothetical protein POM88_037711 [Heracleum sosnowskyi]